MVLVLKVLHSMHFSFNVTIVTLKISTYLYMAKYIALCSNINYLRNYKASLFTAKIKEETEEVN